MIADAPQQHAEAVDCGDNLDKRILDHHVDPQRFFELALSSRKLLRDDRSSAGLRGLLDAETGHRFVIEEEKLFDALGHV